MGPPSYEEAMGIAPTSSSSTPSIYTSAGNVNSGFTYSSWVNPESSDQTSTSNIRSSIYTMGTHQEEPYVMQQLLQPGYSKNIPQNFNEDEEPVSPLQEQLGA